MTWWAASANTEFVCTTIWTPFNSFIKVHCANSNNESYCLRSRACTRIVFPLGCSISYFQREVLGNEGINMGFPPGSRDWLRFRMSHAWKVRIAGNRCKSGKWLGNRTTNENLQFCCEKQLFSKYSQSEKWTRSRYTIIVHAHSVLRRPYTMECFIYILSISFDIITGDYSLFIRNLCISTGKKMPHVWAPPQSKQNRFDNNKS